MRQASKPPMMGLSSYDNALAETINGLYKTELTKPGEPWRSIEDASSWPPSALGRLVRTIAASTCATSRRSNSRLPHYVNAVRPAAVAEVSDLVP